MTIAARRRVAKLVLLVSLVGGGAALAANTAMTSPTSDGGLPGDMCRLQLVSADGSFTTIAPTPTTRPCL
jgi:hypothetical protein